MEIDPSLEVEFRAKLARSYIKKAEKFLSTGDFKECVEASQLSAENAGKAVIALRRIPSWSHDPSSELIEVLGELKGESREAVKGLAEIVHSLAPEHGLTSYGKPVEGLTPWDLYDKTKARECFEKAEKALELMNRIIRIEKTNTEEAFQKIRDSRSLHPRGRRRK